MRLKEAAYLEFFKVRRGEPTAQGTKTGRLLNIPERGFILAGGTKVRNPQINRIYWYVIFLVES